MAEKPPTNAARKAAEIRYRNREFGPGPEGPEPSKQQKHAVNGVYYGGGRKSTMPIYKSYTGKQRI